MLRDNKQDLQQFFNRLKEADVTERPAAVEQLVQIVRNCQSRLVKDVIFNMVLYVRDHGRFAGKDGVGHALLEQLVIECQSRSQFWGPNQRIKVMRWSNTQFNTAIDRSDDEGGMYCTYDGPNDPDRYMGHGEFDTDDGYWLAD